MGRLGDYLGIIGSGIEPPMPPPPINEWAAAAAQQAQANQMYAQQAMANAQNTYTPPPGYHDRARDLFVKRMSGVRSEFKLGRDDFLHCHVHGDIVFVFFLLQGKEGIVKEAVDIFPSDQLVAQFRMIAA